MADSIAIVTEATATSNRALVAAASVAAYLLERAGIDVSLHIFSRTDPSPCELDIYNLRPSLIALWLYPEQSPDYTTMLSRLGPVNPRARIILLGPLLVTPFDAETLLQHYPDAMCAIRGEAEKCLEDLCRAGTLSSGGLEPPDIAGVSWRIRDSFRHDPDRLTPLLPEQLASPFASGLVPLDPKRGCSVEVLRGAFPFSPLSLEIQPGRPRPLPMNRVRDDLTRLLEAGIQQLFLVCGPLDIIPAHLRWLLRMLESLDHRAGIHVALRHAPDEALADTLRKAGVTHITYTVPAAGDSAGQGDHLLTLTVLRRLKEHGFHVTVRLPLGWPGDDLETLRMRFDYFMMSPLTSIQFDPLSIWPGHPLCMAGPKSAANVAGAAPSTVVAGPPTFEVLGTPQLPFPMLAGLKAQLPRLNHLLATYPRGLKLLGEVVGATPSSLLQQVRDWLLTQARRLDERGRSFSERRSFTRFARTLLAGAGRQDRWPALECVIDFEHWIHEPRELPRRPRSVEYSVAELEQSVPAQMPGLELRTFSYDPFALENGTDLEQAPSCLTHVLLRSLGPRPAWTEIVDKGRKTLFDAVDGRRTVEEVFEVAQTVGPLKKMSTWELQEVFLRMLEAEILYVKNFAGQNVDESGRLEQRKILPFRIDRRRSRTRSKPDSDRT